MTVESKIRLRCDRGPIATRSGPWSSAITAPSIAESRLHLFQIHQTAWIEVWPRSLPDWGQFTIKSGLNYRGIGATIYAKGIRPHDALKRLPWPLQLPTIFRLIFPLKTHVFSLCSLTFDRFVKELSEFRGRSLIHRDPPTFRLDCEAIGAGLIMKFSLISLNFPLEFRTSTRKNPSKFTSIYKNWSPILVAIGLVVRFDRLSEGNLSFFRFRSLILQISS